MNSTIIYDESGFAVGTTTFSAVISCGGKEPNMLADQFLERWTMKHIDAGTQEADIPKLADQLEADAAREDISREALEYEARQTLREHIIAAIHEAIAQDLR